MRRAATRQHPAESCGKSSISPSLPRWHSVCLWCKSRAEMLALHNLGSSSPRPSPDGIGTAGRLVEPGAPWRDPGKAPPPSGRPFQPLKSASSSHAWTARPLATSVDSTDAHKGSGGRRRGSPKIMAATVSIWQSRIPHTFSGNGVKSPIYRNWRSSQSTRRLHFEARMSTQTISFESRK